MCWVAASTLNYHNLLKYLNVSGKSRFYLCDLKEDYDVAILFMYFSGKIKKKVVIEKVSQWGQPAFMRYVGWLEI